jgi:hypothetical protein
VEWLAVPAVTLSNLFICFSSLFIYLIPKNIGAIDRPLAGTYSTHPDVLSQHSLLTCFVTGETTDETTSHSARLSKGFA